MDQVRIISRFKDEAFNKQVSIWNINDLKAFKSEIERFYFSKNERLSMSQFIEDGIQKKYDTIQVELWKETKENYWIGKGDYFFKYSDEIIEKITELINK